MIPTKFNGYFAGRRRMFLDMGGSSTTVQAAPAPDYGPMAQASKESAQIMADLGNKQLTEAQRQYDLNMQTARPVAEAQLELMRQAKGQGDEYFNYWKTKAQPVENALNEEAMAAGSDQKQQEAVDRAVADSQGGFTRAINQTLRQARRYGINPVLNGGDLVAGQGQATAAAATGARDREKALGFAKKMDVAGLYRGMPGASQGAYTVANQSGNAAVGNAMAPGGALMNGMAQGAGTIGSGRGMLQNGLGGILNAQGSYANTLTNANIQSANLAAQQDAGLGSMLGMIGGMAGKYAFSSKKLKHSGKAVDGEEVLDKLKRTPVESWKYKDGVADEGRHVGPYAEDVQKEFGDEAAPNGEMLDMVTMNGINMAAIKELSRKVDRLEGRYGLKKRG